MKTFLTRLLKILALIVPVLLFVFYTQTYLFNYSDINAERIRRFYLEEENSLDVVFLGSSEVGTGFAPVMAYEEFGFTSYLYATDGSTASFYKYQLDEVCSTQQPQVILVELQGFLYDDDYQIRPERFRTFVENIPFSMNKLEAIFRYDVEDKITYLFPFIKYHGEWIKPDKLMETYRWKTDTAKGPNMWKGVNAWSRPIVPYDAASRQVAAPQEGAGSLNEAYLVDFLEYCKKEGYSNILFVRFPHRNAPTYENAMERTAEILSQYGYPLLNLEDHFDAMELDLSGDFYDNEHLNIYGQEKLTSYLGRYLATEVLDTPIVQSEENAKHWAECVSTLPLYRAYAYDMVEQGIERWIGEDSYELGRFEAWKKQS